MLCAVRWHLRYSLSFRDVEERFTERGLEADHTTIWRWVQRYGPELEQRLRRHLKPTTKSWRVDETYVRVKGRWCYLYRAIDSRGATIDFVPGSRNLPVRCVCSRASTMGCSQRGTCSRRFLGVNARAKSDCLTVMASQFGPNRTRRCADGLGGEHSPARQ